MATAIRSFEATVRSGHKAQCAVEVPFDPEEAWGLKPAPVFPGRRGYEVRATIGKGWFESFVVPRMKRWWLLIETAQLDAAGVAVGDVVHVRLEGPAEPA
jgi:hypothetical protein